MADTKKKHFPDPEHDHRACIEEALSQAEALCRIRGVRLTSLRRRVLEIIWESHAPLGAYDVLERMNAGGERNAPAHGLPGAGFSLKTRPHTPHREPERIRGLRHAGGRPTRPSSSSAVIAEPWPRRTARKSARRSRRAPPQAGFQVDTPVVEISGQCPECCDD